MRRTQAPRAHPALLRAPRWRPVGPDFPRNERAVFVDFHRVGCVFLVTGTPKTAVFLWISMGNPPKWRFSSLGFHLNPSKKSTLKKRHAHMLGRRSLLRGSPLHASQVFRDDLPDMLFPGPWNPFFERTLCLGSSCMCQNGALFEGPFWGVVEKVFSKGNWRQTV